MGGEVVVVHLQVVLVISNVLLNETLEQATFGEVFSNLSRVLVNLELLKRIPAVER